MGRRAGRRGCPARAAGAAIALAIAVSACAGHQAPSAVPAGVRAGLGPRPAALVLRGDVLNLLAPPAIYELARFEQELSEVPGIAMIYGPITWLRGRLGALAATVAADVRQGAARRQALVRAGISGTIGLGNTDLLGGLVFGTAARPRPALGWLFPSPSAVRIFLRIAPGAARGRTYETVRALYAASDLVAAGETLELPAT